MEKAAHTFTLAHLLQCRKRPFSPSSPCHLPAGWSQHSYTPLVSPSPCFLSSHAHQLTFDNLPLTYSGVIYRNQLTYLDAFGIWEESSLPLGHWRRRVDSTRTKPEARIEPGFLELWTSSTTHCAMVPTPKPHFGDYVIKHLWGILSKPAFCSKPIGQVSTPSPSMLS